MVILFGPTAVGKSECAEKLALELGIKTALVNIDMASLYTPLTIGTAKPDWKKSTVPHYLFDVVDEPHRMTAIEYRNVLLTTLNQLWAENTLPILVGGSGFYIKTLFYPPAVELPSQEEPTFVEAMAHDDLWSYLHKVDPNRAQAIHPHDTYRIKRALTIWSLTGKQPSAFEPKYKPVADYFLLCLTRDKKDLHDRINNRVDTMISSGWVEEVAGLKGTSWEPFLMGKKIIGYDDLFHYIDDQLTLREAAVSIKQKTRAYAKRQLTFWRMLESQLLKAHEEYPALDATVESVDLTSLDIDLYIKQLSKIIRDKIKR